MRLEMDFLRPVHVLIGANSVTVCSLSAPMERVRHVQMNKAVLLSLFLLFRPPDSSCLLFPLIV